MKAVCKGQHQGILYSCYILPVCLSISLFSLISLFFHLQGKHLFWNRIVWKYEFSVIWGLILLVKKKSQFKINYWIWINYFLKFYINKHEFNSAILPKKKRVSNATTNAPNLSKLVQESKVFLFHTCKKYGYMGHYGIWYSLHRLQFSALYLERNGLISFDLGLCKESGDIYSCKHLVFRNVQEINEVPITGKIIYFWRQQEASNMKH